MKYFFLIVFFTANIVNADLSDEDRKYINSLPDELFASSDLKKYMKFPKFKATAISIKNDKVNYDYASRIAKADSQAEANNVALAMCETRTGYDCIIFYEGSKRVFKKNLTSYLSGNLIGFTQTQVNICGRYGFTGQNKASCARDAVMKVLNDWDKSSIQYGQNQNKPSINWQGLGKLGQDILDRENAKLRPSPPRPKICSYSCPNFEKVTTNEGICPFTIRYKGNICNLD